MWKNLTIRCINARASPRGRTPWYIFLSRDECERFAFSPSNWGFFALFPYSVFFFATPSAKLTCDTPGHYRDIGLQRISRYLYNRGKGKNEECNGSRLGHFRIPEGDRSIDLRYKRLIGDGPVARVSPIIFHAAYLTIACFKCTLKMWRISAVAVANR